MSGNKKDLIAAILLLIVAAIFIGFFILGDNLNQEPIVSDDTQDTEQQTTEKNSENLEQACINLGCEKGTKYVGSKNSDKFYPCTCYYADRIHQENIVCFKTKQEAQQQDYHWIDC